MTINLAIYFLCSARGGSWTCHTAVCSTLTVHFPDPLFQNKRCERLACLKLLLKPLHPVGDIHHADVGSGGGLVRWNVGHLCCCCPPHSLQTQRARLLEIHFYCLLSSSSFYSDLAHSSFRRLDATRHLVVLVEHLAVQLRSLT